MGKLSTGWEWDNKFDSYECPYCLVLVSPVKTLKTKNYLQPNKSIYSYLYFCNNCGRPTFQDGLKNNESFPKKPFGQKIELPEKYQEIQEGFEELKKCISVDAFTAAVMIGRKLLTIITYNYPEISDKTKTKIEEGSINFSESVHELKEIHALPPINYHLLDKIRKLGNDANHKLVQKSKKEAKEIYEAIELIMKTFENAEDKKEDLNEIKNNDGK